MVAIANKIIGQKKTGQELSLHFPFDHLRRYGNSLPGVHIER
jgi:hypothetical protein